MCCRFVQDKEVQLTEHFTQSQEERHAGEDLLTTAEPVGMPFVSGASDKELVIFGKLETLNLCAAVEPLEIVVCALRNSRWDLLEFFPARRQSIRYLLNGSSVWF